MNKKNLGFTLIELLVVIGIIGILAGGLMVVLNPGAQMGKARDAIRKSDLKQLQIALEAYYNDHNVYPSTGGPEGNCTYSGWGVTKPYSGTGAYIPGLAPDYIPILPGDPNVNGIPARCYLYYTNDGGKSYTFSAHQGVEGTVNPNDNMIRVLNCEKNPTTGETIMNNDIIVTHPSFVITSIGSRCWQ